MTTQRISTPVRLISLLIGVGLLFIGGRFLLAPEAGEAGFGLNYQQPNFAFHYVKGIRDIFSSLIIMLLAWSHYRKPLLLTLLAGSLIPFTDMLIVWQTPGSTLWAMFIHGGTVVTLWLLCYFLRESTPELETTPSATTETQIKRTSSAAEGGNSVLELTILPGENTPPHYHQLFSETFEVLKGALVVGQGNQTLTLHEGQTATILPGQTHSFRNTSGSESLIKVTASPGNQDFEESLLIYKGLANDGLASASGTPKRLTDLALFVRLNDSHSVGFQKITGSLFAYLSRRAIRQGRLAFLQAKYVRPVLS